jgi:RTP801 C-terminal region
MPSTKIQQQQQQQQQVAVEEVPDDSDLFLRTLPHWNEDEVEHVRNVLMETLRDAKARHLACTEVLLPCDMLQSIAIDMLRASDEEACGIRGANIRIEFEGAEMSEGSRCEIATCNTDPNTVATFELCLVLKQAHTRSKWISAIMPQFIRNLTRGGTIVISRDYQLIKHKLSYSFAE